RADRLAEGLAALLAAPQPDPFARELVIVPARGVERWLSQRLSHRLGPATGRDDGVCAAVDFRSPGSLVAEVLGASEVDPWAADALVWPLLDVVDAAVGEPWCDTLARHLGHGLRGEELELRQGRRYSVARRLARLFASYAAQRPALLAGWERGDDGDGAGADLADDLCWQAELWRRLVDRVGQPSPGQRQAEVVRRLHEQPGQLPLPPRLSLFGHTRIAASEVELLQALAEHRDVHLWLPHPSPAMWRELAGLHGSVIRRDDDSRLRVGHPLLASLGRDLRELQRALPKDPDGPDPQPEAAPCADNLLARLQADIAADRLPDQPRPLGPGDRSIGVYSCHGPARQVEVLREALVGMLADDPTLEPRDILVMCPDIEAYAPLVSAAFGLGDVLVDGHPGQHLRVRLADRALTQTNPLLGVAVAVLDLASGRTEASRVLDLLGLGPVRRRFGLTDEHLDRVAHWVELAGVRWGFDAAHRDVYELSGVVQNTWRFGLDRILAGVAVSADAGAWFGPTLPLDDVSSTDIDLAGRLAECLDRLQRVADAMTGAHPVEHWVTTLTQAIEGLTRVARGEEWQLGQVQRELAAIGGAAGAGVELRLSDLRALLEQRFAGRPTRANFRTGTLTVSTMTPMRSVPHRVVALLGLDDGVFPRTPTVDGDDVLSRRPMTGERDPRSEDRQMLLDAVCAATERLVVTYTGADQSTGQRRPPAVPLKELLDTLDRTAEGAAEAVVHVQPLQSFDGRNFDPAAPFSFDGAALAGARAAAGDRTEPRSVAGVRLSPPSGDLELEQLTGLLCRPVQHFLRHRLGIALLDESEPEPDAIPVELDALQEWAVGDQLLSDLLAGRDRDDALAMAWRRGRLPPGRLGWRLAQRLVDRAAPVAELTHALTAGAPVHAVDVDVDLGDGRRLTGTVSDIHDRRVVRAGYSRLGPKQELEAWLAVLALEAAMPGRGWSAGAVGRGRRDEPPVRVAFAAPAEATRLLRSLVELYDAAMSGPLPLPLKTGRAWAQQRGKGGNDIACRKAAEAEWRPYRSSFPGENADATHVFVWGAGSGFDVLMEDPPRPGEEYDGEDTRLGALAMRLWQPLLAARHVQ
ncbi:MAG: exodeoxyribonuclease V subunit gamma, partial [Marmoricola sp.]